MMMPTDDISKVDKASVPFLSVVQDAIEWHRRRLEVLVEMERVLGDWDALGGGERDPLQTAMGRVGGGLDEEKE